MWRVRNAEIHDSMCAAKSESICRAGKHKRWAELAAIYCRPRPKEPIARAILTLTYHFADRRRRDPDNYSGKMILDGLVRVGILLDDSFDNVELRLKKGEPDRKNQRTVIWIEEQK